MPVGDVVLIQIPYHQTMGGKIRPAVVVLDSGDAVLVVAPVTSAMRFTDYDLELLAWQAAGLNVASCVRVHKLAVLAKANVIRVLGALSRHDRVSLSNVLCRAFCPAALPDGRN